AAVHPPSLHGALPIYGASLKALNTFGVEAQASILAEVRSASELPALFAAIHAHRTPWLALGDGSNILLVDDVPGVVVRPLIAGRSEEHTSELQSRENL